MAGLLKVPPAYAVGLIHCLWHFTLKFAWRDGNLKRFGTEEIARGSKWDGDAEQFVSALESAQFLKSRCVNDWKKYALNIIYQRNYNAKRKQKAYRCKTAVIQEVDRPDGPLPNQTLPDLTLPTNQPTDSGEAPHPPQNSSSTALLAKPGIAETIAYLARAKALGGEIQVTPDYRKPDTSLQKLLLVVKQLQGFNLDDRVWDSVYFKRYGRAAKDLLRFFDDDWKRAGTCAKEISVWLDELGKAWTVETIVKHAPAWKKGGDWKKTHGY